MRTLTLFFLLCISLLVACDEPPHKHSEFEILSEMTFSPTKRTVDLEAIENGVVIFVDVIHEDHLYIIAERLYRDYEDWRVRDERRQSDRSPYQFNQYLFRYNGFLIDIRNTIQLIRIGKVENPKSSDPHPPSEGW